MSDSLADMPTLIRHRDRSTLIRHRKIPCPTGAPADGLQFVSLVSRVLQGLGLEQAILAKHRKVK